MLNIILLINKNVIFTSNKKIMLMKELFTNYWLALIKDFNAAKEDKRLSYLGPDINSSLNPMI